MSNLIARRRDKIRVRPDEVAGMVLLDAQPPDKSGSC